jgi:hypothetical protein
MRVTVHEGRKHLVKRIAIALGHPVKRLIRVAMGPLQLGNLASGRWRYLTEGEVRALRQEILQVRTPNRGRGQNRRSRRPGRRRRSSNRGNTRGSNRRRRT